LPVFEHFLREFKKVFHPLKEPAGKLSKPEKHFTMVLVRNFTRSRASYRLAEFHQRACEEYERNILAEYHDHREDVFVFNNVKDTMKFQEKIEKIKEGAENNSIESLCEWIKREKIEIEAFLEAIAQRDKYDALKNKVQEKQSLLSVEIQTIIGGKSSIKSFLLGKSKEDEVAVLDKQLAEARRVKLKLFHL